MNQLWNHNRKLVEQCKTNINTPALIIDESSIAHNSSLIKSICEASGINFVCSIKSLTYIDTLRIISKYTSEFSVSSFFEAKIAREVLGSTGSIHISTPNYTEKEINAINSICDTVIFNSLPQAQRLKNCLPDTMIGLRINPCLNFVKDERYDPSRIYSKLGTSVLELKEVISERKTLLKRISGIQFHSNCESESFNPILETVSYLDQNIEELLNSIDWINLGGGYLFTDQSDYQPLIEAVSLLQNKYGLTVYVEPGKACIADAGYLVSAVIDLFESDGKQIAVLDTTVNHAPEVFEYQYSPDVIGHTDSGEYEYILAGCSCLAGDLFGEYCFDEPLEIGSRIIFTDMAAYSLVKANMFNGINLPTIYKYSEDGSIELIKEYTYQDYRSRLGETTSETSRKRNYNTSKQESSKVIGLSRS